MKEPDQTICAEPGCHHRVARRKYCELHRPQPVRQRALARRQRVLARTDEERRAAAERARAHRHGRAP